MENENKAITVLVYGLPGSGKTSTINLLKGSSTNDNSTQFYYEETHIGNLNTALQRHNQQKICVIFVLKRDRITNAIHHILPKEKQFLCNPNNPVVLFVSGCDTSRADGYDWWQFNKMEYEKYGFNFTKVVCGTAIDVDAMPLGLQPEFIKMRDTTARELNTAICSNASARWQIIASNWGMGRYGGCYQDEELGPSYPNVPRSRRFDKYRPLAAIIGFVIGFVLVVMLVLLLWD